MSASVVERLEATPVTVLSATSSEAEGGVPAKPGLYAWWVQHGSLAGVPDRQHPSDPTLDLLYVGISPRDADSHQNLRLRLLGNHIGGNVGSSTFRYVLASLLVSTLGLHPRMGAKKVVLTKIEEDDLRRWQGVNLRLTWCTRPAPWEIEDEVIREMKPPLNAAGNSAHPYYPTLKQARAAFRRAATAP
jgi:hypothetical protein